LRVSLRMNFAEFMRLLDMFARKELKHSSKLLRGQDIKSFFKLLICLLSLLVMRGSHVASPFII